MSSKPANPTVFGSVRFRIASWYAILAIISATLLTASGYALLSRHLLDTIQRDLENTATHLEHTYCTIDQYETTEPPIELATRIKDETSGATILHWQENGSGGTAYLVAELTPYLARYNGKTIRTQKLNRKLARERMRGFLELDRSSVEFAVLFATDGTPIWLHSKTGEFPPVKTLQSAQPIAGWHLHNITFLNSG